MNNKRRKEIEELIGRLEEILCETDAIKDDEEEYLNNIPDNLHNSERYEKAENASSNLDSAVSYLNDAIDYLREAIE